MGALAEKAKSAKKSTKSTKPNPKPAAEKKPVTYTKEQTAKIGGRGKVATIERLANDGLDADGISKKMGLAKNRIQWYLTYLRKRKRVPAAA